MKNYDLCIIGGGVPGLALASLLAGSGMSVLVADAGPAIPALKDVKPDGRTAALMGQSIDTLQAAGVWPLLKNHGAPLARMSVVDDSAYPSGADDMIEQTFAAYELDRETFGYNLPLTVMRAALNDRLKTFKNIHIKTDASLKTFKSDGASVALALTGGETMKCRLLVGCDGRNSPVRELAGIDARRRAYGQHAITCLIGHSKSHDDASTEFHRPGGPFTIVPMKGNTSAIVWVEKDEDADAFMKLRRQDFTKALQDRTRSRVGTVELLSNPVSWPLEYLKSQRLTAPRIALAAEAAHVISPIGAQGLNLSLRDVATLAAIVREAHELGLDIGSVSVLNRYERARQPDVVSRSMTIDIANQAVATDKGAIRHLRRLALRALNLPGPWRQLVMKKGLAA